MTYTRLLVGGHSYTVGVEDSPDNGFVDQLDELHGGFTPLTDTLTYSNTLTDTDTFTRADAATIGSTEVLAASWSALRGTWGIATNAANLQTSGGTNNLAVFDTGVADGLIRVTFGSNNDGMGIVFRCQDSNNFLVVKIFATFGTATLSKVVAGVTTQIGSTMNSMPVATGAVYVISYEGSTIHVSAGSALGSIAHQASFSDSTFSTQTKIGIFAPNTIGSTRRWNDLQFWGLTTIGTASQLGYWDIESGKTKLIAPTSAWNLLTWDTGWSDGQIEMVIGAGGLGGAGLAFRVQDASNFLSLRLFPLSTSAGVFKTVAGVSTQIGSTLNGFTTGAGNMVRVMMLGSRIRVEDSSSTGVLGDFTVTDFQTLTKHGFEAQAVDVGTSTSFDSFYATRIQNYGVSGSSVSRAAAESGGTYVDILRQFPTGLTSSDLVVLCWGINDLIFAGSTLPRQYHAIVEALRACMSRALAATVYEDTDGSVAYSAGWSTVSVTNKNSGTGYHKSTTVGATATITVPGGFLGGTVALGFIGPYDDTGGTATVTVDGVLYGTVDTTGLYAQGFGTGNFYTGQVYRVTHLAAGAHTIVITVATASTDGIWFDYWQTESKTNQPDLVVANTARLPPGGYASFWASITDGQVNTLNALLPGLVAEFQ
jgi:hypothetical protein